MMSSPGLVNQSAVITGPSMQFRPSASQPCWATGTCWARPIRHSPVRLPGVAWYPASVLTVTSTTAPGDDLSVPRGSGFLVEEFGGGFGVHEVGPDLFGREQVAFGQGVFGEPGGRVAARHQVQDRGGQVLRDGTGDADRGVGLMAIISADDHPEAEAGQVGGVLVAVTQRTTDQVADRGVQAQREPG